MTEARAPRACALRMSCPERTPPSNSTSQRPPTASTTPGSAEIVEAPPSSCRPPWFDTTSASAPSATTRRASSGSMMPLTISLPFQRARIASRSFQVTEASNCAGDPLRERGAAGARNRGSEVAEFAALARGHAPGPARLGADVDCVAQREPRRHGQAVLRIAAAQAADRNVHRHHQHRAAGRLGPIHQLHRVAPVLHHVELEPERRCASPRAHPRSNRSTPCSGRTECRRPRPRCAAWISPFRCTRPVMPVGPMTSGMARSPPRMVVRHALPRHIDEHALAELQRLEVPAVARTASSRHRSHGPRTRRCCAARAAARSRADRQCC